MVVVNIANKMLSCVQSGHSNKSSSTNSNKAPPPLIPVSNNNSAHKSISRSSGVDKHKLVDAPPFRPDHSRREQPYIVRKVGSAYYIVNRVSLL